MSDTISRQAAIDAAVEAADEWDGGYSRSREEIITLKLRMLPSAQPERKKGKWIPYSLEGLRYKCSECESRYETPWHFCPNCGSYNGGESDDKG